MALTTREKINRACIQIQRKNSFFAYLSLYLKFKEVKKGYLPSDTMAVDKDGNCYYVKEFVDKLSDKELQSGIIHEILHISLFHLLRCGDRNHITWNFSADLCVNSILKNNNFSLPNDWLIPDYNDKFDLGFKKIKEISKKITEQIYDELPKIKMKGMVYVVGEGKNKGKELGKAFDVHIESKGKDGKELTSKEKRKLENKWMERVSEAIIISKMKGDIPAGLERLVENLHRETINWKALLNRFIVNQIPYNFSYCVDKDTFIKTPKGKVKIKDLKINQKIYGLKNDKIILNKVKEKFKSNVKEKFVIYTKSGKRLICSGKHKILTPTGYKKAKDLKIGELCITI